MGSLESCATTRFDHFPRVEIDSFYQGTVFILQFNKEASDEQVLQIGRHFGSLRNFLNMKKKAWLEYYDHETAMDAMERIGDQEMLHLDEPIEVSA